MLFEVQDEDESRDEDQSATDSKQTAGDSGGDTYDDSEGEALHRAPSVGQAANVIAVIRIIAAAAISLLLFGCTGPHTEATTTTLPMLGADSPEHAVRSLLESVEAGDIETASEMAIQPQVALFVAVEGASAAEAARLLTEGVPDESQALLWSSFEEAYVRASGEQLSDMLVARGDRFTVDGVDFAMVDVAFRRRAGQGEWIVQRDADGRWHVDLVATFGSTLAQQLRLWLVTLTPGRDLDTVVAAIADQRPSLLAALQRQPLGPISPGVAEQIKGLLSDVGAGGSDGR